VHHSNSRRKNGVLEIGQGQRNLQTFGAVDFGQCRGLFSSYCALMAMATVFWRCNRGGALDIDTRAGGEASGAE